MESTGMRAQAELQQQLVREASPAWYRRAVIIMSLAFLLIFAGYNAAQGLQSSINGDLGYINLAALYSTFAVCCVVVPALIHRIEARGASTQWLLPVSTLAFVAIVLINIRPVPPKGTPGYVATAVAYLSCSCLVGVAAPVLWTMQSVYVGRCALHAARCSAEQDGPEQGVNLANERRAISRTTSVYSGLFFTFYQFSGAVGSSLSSVVLLLGGGNSRTVLFALLGVIVLAGSISTMALPKIPPAPVKTGAAATDGQEEEATGKCLQTLSLCAKENQMALMIPVIFANGVFLGFIFSDYPKAFVSATIGPAFTGAALTVFYLTNSMASAGWGWVIHSGRLGVWGSMVIAFVLQLLVLLVLLACSMHRLPLFRQHYEFVPGVADVQHAWVEIGSGAPEWWEFIAPFGCAAVAAIGDSVYESQPPAILQSAFQDTRVVSAMANYKLWQSLGFTASFLMGAFVPSLTVRIATLIALFLFSFVALVVLHKCVATLSGKERPASPRTPMDLARRFSASRL